MLLIEYFSISMLHPVSLTDFRSLFKMYLLVKPFFYNVFIVIEKSFDIVPLFSIIYLWKFSSIVDKLWLTLIFRGRKVLLIFDALLAHLSNMHPNDAIRPL